nr:hypothetical protein Iba_chr11cCG11170 [Ipomoea batatas]
MGLSVRLDGHAVGHRRATSRRGFSEGRKLTSAVETTRWTSNKKGERRGCGWSSRIPQHRYLPPQGSPEEERRDHVADEPPPATPPPLPLLHCEQRATIVVCCSHRRDQHAEKTEEQGTITAAAVHLPTSTADAGSRPPERPRRETTRRCFAPSPPKRTEKRGSRSSLLEDSTATAIYGCRSFIFAADVDAILPLEREDEGKRMERLGAETSNKKGERRGCGWSSRIPQHRYLPPQGSPEEERRDHVADEPPPATPPPLPLLHCEQRATIVVCCSHRRDQHAGKTEEQGTITAAAVHLLASTADAGSRPPERPRRETARQCFAPSPPKRTEKRGSRSSLLEDSTATPIYGCRSFIFAADVAAILPL